MGNFSLFASGITPGSWHTIARAETFALLAALQSFRLIYIAGDSRGVVSGVQSLLRKPFDPLKWRGHPNLIFGY